METIGRGLSAINVRLVNEHSTTRLNNTPLLQALGVAYNHNPIPLPTQLMPKLKLAS
jgi:hypothetical protein